MPSSSDLTHMVIAKEPGRHLAFPDICKVDSGSLLLVFRNGVRHVDPSGHLQVCHCPDPQASLQFEGPQLICDTDLDDRDPSVTQLSDGTVFVNFFRMDCQTQDLRLTLVRSSDGGRTWEAPYDIVVPGFSKGVATSESIVEVSPGELIMPLYGSSDCEGEGSFLLRSYDNGFSWPEVTPLAVYEYPIFEESSLTRLEDNRLVALLRTDNRGLGYLYQTISTDKGRTWSSPERLNLWGYPAHVLPLSNGGVLATYGYRQLPTGVRSCLTEGNLDWSITRETPMRYDGNDGGELGYPSSVELQNGEVFTVYYFTDRQGGFPYIVGTRYTPQ